MAEIRLLPPPRSHGRLAVFLILAAAPFAFGALALWLGQDANWDLRNYHWYNAYALLNGRYNFDLLPSQTPWFYNPVLDVPFYLLATHVSAKTAGFTLGFIQGLNFIPLFFLAYAALIIKNNWAKITVCTALTALGMLGGGGIALIGTTFYDNVTSLGYFLSALLVIHNHHRLMAAKEFDAFRLALLFGLPAGLMMGLKLPGVVFAIGWCFGILAMGGSPRRLLIISFGFGVGVLLGVLISLGPWAWFLQTHFGSPLFPYFNDIFNSPLAPPTSARDIQFLPHTLHDVLLFPFVFADNPYRVGEIPWRDWRIPVLYVLLPAALILRLVLGKPRHQQIIVVPFVGRYLMAVAILSYAVWLHMFSIYRYAVPLEMIAPLVIVAAVASLSFNVPARATLAAFMLVVIAFSIQPGNWHRRDAWLDRFVEADVPPLHDTDLMILMAGYEPYSHVISEFPHEIPFVRIESNFASPGEDKGINQIIRSRVAGHKGPFMLLIPPWQLNLGEEALASFHLTLAGKTCQTVLDRLYDDKLLSLCAVKQKSQE